MKYDKKVIRRYKDMKDRFKQELKGNKNPVIYNVYIRNFGSFEIGLTVINSGKIGKEFFMTKGHRHKKGMEEMYMLVSGEGKLIIKNKKLKKINMKKNKIYIVPGKAGHRLVNTGKKKLEVLTVYNKDSGHDYNFKF